MDSKPSWVNGKIVHASLLIALSFSLSALISANRADAQSSAAQTSSLIGTIQSGGFIGAVLSDAKGEQVFYRMKEKLPDGSRIVEVRSNSILLKSADGTFYDMYISSKAVASSNSGALSASVVPPPPAEQAPAPQVQNRQHTRRHGRPTEDDN
jgi:hypothetical protein